MSGRLHTTAPASITSLPALVGGIGMATAAGAASVLAYGHFIELNRFQVREERLAVLPPGSPDIVILHISDMHMIPGQRRKTAFMHGLAELQPDLVINTGDNLQTFKLPTRSCMHV